MGETKKQKKKAQPRRKQKPEMPSCFVTDMDQYLFGQGNHYDIFRKLVEVD